jgi:hypothetical protein
LVFFFFLNDNEIFISHNQKTQTFTSLKLMADPKDYFEDIAWFLVTVSYPIFSNQKYSKLTERKKRRYS